MSVFKEGTNVWTQPGPAKAYYDRVCQLPQLRDVLIAKIRDSWGNPAHSGLELFPEVSREETTLRGLDGNDVSVTRFTPPNVGTGTWVYLHGGAWISPISGKHLAWAKRMAALTRWTVIAVNYRLGPEDPFPAALHDVIGVVQHCQKNGSGPVVVGGDSAGGNLGPAAAFYAADHDLQAPEAVLALCPATNMVYEEVPGFVESAWNHPIQDLTLFGFGRSCYVPRIEDWRHPYVSPVYGDLSRLPPLMVVIGEQDAMCEDNRIFVDRARAAGAHVEDHVYAAMPHSFFMQDELIPEASAQANADIAAFLARL
ncbi:Monoterpene epsilon-lactone hydrolase [Symmachiella macrocystis]|uniref:Monoterpene epsilon-lactone hydrolase n=1 Tax=Symmachiella macrocystis TaxID=2527985 RepID=A0A5C6AY48_9PLAN|nr:alpha/beta hydrolase [Symmachiella macrocystis]TWU03054.1 Monoterpene epsilon-lactone hydrolase [Symmachiella macrocystis]